MKLASIFLQVGFFSASAKARAKFPQTATETVTGD